MKEEKEKEETTDNCTSTVRVLDKFFFILKKTYCMCRLRTEGT